MFDVEMDLGRVLVLRLANFVNEDLEIFQRLAVAPDEEATFVRINLEVRPMFIGTFRDFKSKSEVAQDGVEGVFRIHKRN